jgi:hypothetical protein
MFFMYSCVLVWEDMYVVMEVYVLCIHTQKADLCPSSLYVLVPCIPGRLVC